MPVRYTCNNVLTAPSSNVEVIMYVDALWKVCGLKWNRHENEIVSAHGYSNNQLSVWSYPSMEKVADINWHKRRVLELSQVVSHTKR
jgi:WD40 repeat protein